MQEMMEEEQRALPAGEIAPLRAHILLPFPATAQENDQRRESLDILMKIHILMHIFMFAIYIMAFIGMIDASADAAKDGCLFVTGAYIMMIVSSFSISLVLSLLQRNHVAVVWGHIN